MTILFIDDQEPVLRGIERMLEAAEVEWDTEFVTSGSEALTRLAADAAIDTVVTDMKMPGMDGAQFLTVVSDRYPHIVRVVLSGEADKEAVLRAVKPMHQYLSKPCDASTLVSTIARAGALRDILISDRLQRMMGGIPSLPSVPGVYRNLMTAMEDEDVSTDDVGDIVAQDPAMTTKILQLVNSAVFGLRQSVADPGHAVGLLGIDTIRALTLTVGVFQQYEQNGLAEFSIEDLMQHSLKVAWSGRRIALAEHFSKDQTAEAFTGGLLHDVGKLVLLQAAPTEFRETLKKSKQDAIPAWRAEVEIFGASHAEIGARLLSMWGIPQSIVEIVALHHAPDQAGERLSSTLTAVCAANELCRTKSASDLLQQNTSFAEYLSKVNCVSQLENWSQICSDTLNTEATSDHG